MSFFLKQSPETTVVTVSNTVESSHQFDGNVKAFTIQCNEFELIRYSWKASEVVSGDEYGILYPRESYSEEDLMMNNSDGGYLYMHAPDAAASVKVVVHTWY